MSIECRSGVDRRSREMSIEGIDRHSIDTRSRMPLVHMIQKNNVRNTGTRVTPGRSALGASLSIIVIAFDEGERYLITWFFPRGIDYVPRVSIAMPVDFRVWTPSWTGTLSLDSIWTGTRSLDSMCHIASIPFD